MKFTMNDVARAAGVSPITVSRAFRDHPKCSQATRERVLAVAKRMGYQPNAVAALMSSLRKTKKPTTYSLAILNPFNDRKALYTGPRAELTSGAIERAASLGLDIQELWLADDPTDPSFRPDDLTYVKKVMRTLKARGITGLILPAAYNNKLIQADWEDFSVAIGLHSSLQPRHHASEANWSYNLRLAFTKLRERGYQRIGLCLSNWLDITTMQSYTSTFLRIQHDLAESSRVRFLTDREIGANPLKSRLRKVEDWIHRERVDAVICSNCEVVPALENAGLRVPEDIGVAHLWHAPDVADWSGVAPQLRAIGAALVDLVLVQLQTGERGVPRHPRSVYFHGEWVEGRTTRPPPEPGPVSH